MRSSLWRTAGLFIAHFSQWTAAAINPATVLPDRCEDMQPRLEIRDLAQNPDQMTVFLLAMKRMKEANQNDPMGYYQLAGIHGYPYVPYDDIQRCEGCDPQMGFCPHISHIFAIWHRPYMALFEKSLTANALAAAAEFPEGPVKQRYTAAARTLRLPYWDFLKPAAPGQNILPPIFTEEQVTLQLPQGRTTIENPLFQYTFNGAPAPDWDPLVQTKTTRHPMTNAREQSRQDLAISAMQNLQRQDSGGHDIRCGAYRLLYREGNIDQFAGSGFVGGVINTPYDNIESIHDDIHIAIGGNGTDVGNQTTRGTMWYINAASFDPIFWSHHAMVDRLFGFWQVLHPESWIGEYTGTNTWTINTNMSVNSKTPLMPFFKDAQGTPWTSDDSRQMSRFCYHYPDLKQDTTFAQVSATINQLYAQGCLVNPPQSAPDSPQFGGSSLQVPPPGTILESPVLAPPPQGGSNFQPSGSAPRPPGIIPGPPAPSSPRHGTPGPSQSQPGISPPGPLAFPGTPGAAQAGPGIVPAGQSVPRPLAPPPGSPGSVPAIIPNGPGLASNPPGGFAQGTPGFRPPPPGIVPAGSQGALPPGSPGAAPAPGSPGAAPLPGTPGAPPRTGFFRRHLPAKFAPAVERRDQKVVHTKLNALSQNVKNLMTDSGAMRDYVINVRMDSMAMGEPTTIYVFDGEPGPDSSTFEQSEHFIGRRVFLTKHHQNMPPGNLHRGTVNLNHALMMRAQDGRLESLSNEHVATHLKEKMTWRAVKSDGTIVPSDQVPGLMVTVVTADVTPADLDSQLPVWGNPTLLREATMGKPGGYVEEASSEGMIGRMRSRL